MTSSVSRLSKSLPVLVLLLTGACGKRAAVPEGRSKPVIRIGEEVVTLAEIDGRIGPELFDMRSSAMRAMLIDHLLRAEARKRGVTLDEMRRHEIEEKVPLPSDAEATAALTTWVDQQRLKPEEAARMTPALAADRLRAMRFNDAEEAFYDRLMKDYEVHVDFAALGKPKLNMALDGPTLGPDSAPIKIVEFADLSKSFTSMWQRTLEQLLEKYPSRVQLRFKQKPSAPDTPSARLAEGALCAHDQGHYWDFRKALLKQTSGPTPSTMGDAAVAAKLDVAAFDRCVSSGAKKQTVAQNAREALRNRLEGDPVITLNGMILSGAQDLATIERLIRIESDGV